MSTVQSQALRVRPSVRKLPFAWCIRVLIAAGLLLEAVLKIHQLSTEPVAKYELFGKFWLTFFAEFKILFALWLISGIHKRLSWLVAVGLLALGSGVTLWQGLAGLESCGCLGRIRLSPWYAMSVYALGLALVLIFRPPLRVAQPARRYWLKLAAVIVVTAGAGIPSALAVARYRPATISQTGEIVGTDRFVVLEPQAWTGEQFPLASHIDVGGRLMQGRWTVLLYHYDCPFCREAIGKYEAEARKLSQRNDPLRIALVAVPPWGPPEQSPVAKDTACLAGRLAEGRDWFVATPAVIELIEGKVAAASDAQTSYKAPAYDLRLAGTVAPAAVIKLAGDEAQYDFGLVAPGSAHSVIFSIANPAPKALAIRSAASECQCMAAPQPPGSIAAGSSADLRVNFVAPAQRMDYSKRILVATDNPQRPSVVIRVKAAVGRPLEVQPPRLDLGTLILGQHARKSVEVVNAGEAPVRLIYAISGQGGCTALVPAAAVPARGRLAVPIEVRAERSGSGRSDIRIQTASQDQPQLDLSVVYQVSDAYRASQGSVDLGKLAPSGSVSGTLELEAAKDSPGSFVAKAELVDLSGATGQTQVSIDGRRATIRCQMTAGSSLGPIRGALRISLEGMARPVEFPLSGSVEPAAAP